MAATKRLVLGPPDSGFPPRTRCWPTTGLHVERASDPGAMTDEWLYFVGEPVGINEASASCPAGWTQFRVRFDAGPIVEHKPLASASASASEPIVSGTILHEPGGCLYIVRQMDGQNYVAAFGVRDHRLRDIMTPLSPEHARLNLLYVDNEQVI